MPLAILATRYSGSYELLARRVRDPAGSRARGAGDRPGRGALRHDDMRLAGRRARAARLGRALGSSASRWRDGTGGARGVRPPDVPRRARSRATEAAAARLGRSCSRSARACARRASGRTSASRSWRRGRRSARSTCATSRRSGSTSFPGTRTRRASSRSYADCARPRRPPVRRGVQLALRRRRGGGRAAPRRAPPSGVSGARATPRVGHRRDRARRDPRRDGARDRRVAASVATRTRRSRGSTTSTPRATASKARRRRGSR